MEEFNRQKLMENINDLIQQKNLKIGEVEAAIGVSVGYLSRLTKKETDNAPAADIIWKLAKYLGVSTDMLIEGDFSKATDNLQYMRKFILKLKTMTDANDIEWDTITVADVDDALHSTSEEEELPIIGKYTGKPVTDEKPKSAEYRDYSLPEYGTKKVKSAAIGERVWVNGNGYKAGLGNGTTMYLFKMSGDFPIDAEGNTEIIDYYDIYFMEWVLRDGCDDSYGQPDDKDYERHFSPVCNTWNNARDISKDIAALYKSISRHEWDLKISPHVRSSIESFMNPVSLDDEMPFI